MNALYNTIFFTFFQETLKGVLLLLKNKILTNNVQFLHLILTYIFPLLFLSF